MSKPEVDPDQFDGYTLFEIVGVIFLIGLIMSLARPNFFRVEERNRMRYVGELLQTDLQRVQAEAKTGNRVKVNFAAHGYAVELGEFVIKRDYRVNGITFKITTTAETTETNGVGESDLIKNLSELPATINWESKHYQGALALTPDGVVSWRYHEK
jgi:type II secretory pathway pseudopilin PulG